MKKPQILILALFAGLIAAFIYADNPHYYQNRLYRKARRYSKKYGKQFGKQCENVTEMVGNYSGTVGNCLEKLSDKLPF